MNENDQQRARRLAGIAADSPLLQPHAIEVQYDAMLTTVLDGLGIHWTVGRPPNGAVGSIRIQLDREGDFLLEQIIGQLSGLRWQYTPGRTLQLEMRFEDMECEDGSH